MADNTQIYSATYSNVPVFEFVTLEGPIMRRKLDSWINATHILKIAKFPKAKRTRILEKDVQTGTHEKVQGGYGKYQGTYIPLELGVDIAKNFGVYDTLRPIFEFTYVEGKSETPPPAPKHSHASASNVAKRQASLNSNSGNSNANPPNQARKTKSATSLSGEPPKKRGRPRRVPIQGNIEPTLQHTDTTPISNIPESGPSIGTFNTKKGQPTLTRQDTEQDALNIMSSNMNTNNEDLELADKSSDEDMGNGDIGSQAENIHHDDNEELMTGHELFGTPRDSFERVVHSHNQNHNHLNGSSIHDPYGLLQYHHQVSASHNPSMKDDTIYAEYFSNLLNYFLEDGHNSKIRSNHEIHIPNKIINPPQPLSKININQPIDNDGNTIFHWACSMANTLMIEFLLSAFDTFLNSDIKNNKGETPLMFLVKFSNSYQLKNFPTLLDLLFDSILSIDNSGRTVLHHIAKAANGTFNEGSVSANTDIQSYKKNKERFSRYYIECLFAKIVEFQEYRHLQESEVGKRISSEDKKELLAKFINHQDIDGNTAFHIVAYNMNKKCIKVFISYHKYIDFQLKNLVSYTVEEYLASHNHVLRLDANNDDSKEIQKVQEETYKYLYTYHLPKNWAIKNNSTQSFESQLYFSKIAVNLQNTTANLITEKLTELAYAVDKELSGKDEKLSVYFKLLRSVNHEKLLSQRAILEFFKLDYLIDNIESEYRQNNNDSNNDYLLIDSEKDKIIQDEINRLISDLSFQFLQKKEQLEKAFRRYVVVDTKLRHAGLLLHDEATSIKDEQTQNGDTDRSERLRLAAELQSQIILNKTLLEKLHHQHLHVPVSAQKDNNSKENKENINEDTPSVSSVEPQSVIARYPKDDKLNKYCKLIASCCGMNFNEVENSIDLIEQSLSKSVANK